jgi:hypothetical protein
LRRLDGFHREDRRLISGYLFSRFRDSMNFGVFSAISSLPVLQRPKLGFGLTRSQGAFPRVAGFFAEFFAAITRVARSIAATKYMKTLKVYLDPKTLTEVSLLTDEPSTRRVNLDDLPPNSIDFIEFFTGPAPQFAGKLKNLREEYGL